MKKLICSIPAILLLLVAFLASLSELAAQEVSLPSATKLVNFVVANADSTDKEGDATVHHLWFPEIGLQVLVSTLGKENQTLEIYDYDFRDGKEFVWCLNFSCQSGNIYGGLYANKYLPASAKGKVAQFETIITMLNSVSVEKLNRERTEQKKLYSQIQKWGQKAISYEDYANVYDLDIFDQLGVVLDWRGDVLSESPAPVKVMFFYEPNLEALRKVAAALPAQGKKN